MSFNNPLDGYDLIEILPDLFRIPVPLTGNPLKELNCYVFRKNQLPGSRNLIVDTGFKWEICYNAISEGLNKLGISLDETDILLTHFHADHTGNCPRLVREGTRVFLGEKEYDFVVDVEKKSSYYNSLIEVANRFAKYGINKDVLDAMVNGVMTELATDKCFTLDFNPVPEGSIIRAGSYDLKAIHTPGHTPGHMCYEIVGYKAMLLGDHVLFDITPNVTAWAGKKDSLGDYLASLDKINSYDVDIPLPGHRHAGEFHKRIDQIKKHHSRRIQECYDTISGLGKAYLNSIAGNVHWKIKDGNWDQFQPIQRWFALGECMAHLDYLKVRDMIEETEDESGIVYFKVK